MLINKQFEQISNIIIKYKYDLCIIIQIYSYTFYYSVFNFQHLVNGNLELDKQYNHVYMGNL